MKRLHLLEQELIDTLHYLHTCDQCQPVRTTADDCPQCPVDHGVKEEPTLVAGFHKAARPQGGANGGGISIPLGTKSR